MKFFVRIQQMAFMMMRVTQFLYSEIMHSQHQQINLFISTWIVDEIEGTQHMFLLRHCPQTLGWYKFRDTQGPSLSREGPFLDELWHSWPNFFYERKVENHLVTVFNLSHRHRHHNESFTTFHSLLSTWILWTYSYSMMKFNTGKSRLTVVIVICLASGD